MRLNKYLASTLFTGLFVTASIFTPALGQEQSLKPQGAWAITKIDKAAQGGNSYCTLSRKYDDGVVLSLGRNQTEEYSLAIDFQKKVFEKDKSLKINLQPGPGQIRAYDLMPASEKAVVIRLGWDEGFFDTLNKSQQMKVKIADKNYTFAMPEITKGQGDLSECMEGLQTAAKSAKGGDKTVADSKDVLNADPKASKEFDAGKADENIRAVKTADANPADNDGDEPKVSAASKRTAGDEEAAPRRNFASKGGSAADKMPEGKAKLRIGGDPDDTAPVAEEENVAEAPKPEVPRAPEPELIERPAPSPAIAAAKLVAEPAAKMAAMSPAAAFERDEAAQNALQKQISDLKAQNEALKQKPAVPSPEAQKQLAAIEAEKAALQQKLAAAQKEKDSAPKPEDVAAAQTRLSELQAKNAQLEDSLRQAQVRIGETAINTETRSIKRIAELETKLQAAQNDNNALAKQLETVRVQQEDSGVTAIAGDWDLEQATRRYNEAEREIRRLGLQLEQERTNCNREKAQIEQMLFDPALADQKQIERLSQLEKDLKGALAKVADTQKLVQQQVAQQVAEKTRNLEADKAGIQAQLATLQKSAGEAQAASADKARLAQQVAELQKTLAAKDTALGQKEQEITDLRAQPKADPAQTAALQAQVKSLNDAIAAKDKAVAEAQSAAQLARAEAAKPKADPAMQAQLAALQGQARSMTEALALKDKAVIDAQNAARAAQAEAARPKVDPALQAQLAAVQAQNKALTDAMGQKDKAVIDAQNAAKAAGGLQASIAAIKADNDALRDQNIVLRQESDKLRIQLTDAQTNGGARADQLASLQLQIDTLKRQAATKDTQLATYQNQLATAQQESAQLKGRLTVADNTRTSSTEEIGVLTRQVQQLQKQVSDLQAEKARPPARSAMADTYASITPAAGYVSSAAPVAPVRAQPVAAIASTALPSGGAASGYDQGAIQSLLQRSGVGANVSRAPSGFAGADNFSWMEGNVRGLASVKMGGNFDSLVNQYITYQKGQCSGDFASMPSPTNGSAAKKMALYEVACVGSGGASQSASLLFFEDQGRFIAIANQIDAGNMDLAMDSRDKIAGFVRGL